MLDVCAENDVKALCLRRCFDVSLLFALCGGQAVTGLAEIGYEEIQWIIGSTAGRKTFFRSIQKRLRKLTEPEAAPQPVGGPAGMQSCLLCFCWGCAFVLFVLHFAGAVDSAAMAVAMQAAFTAMAKSVADKPEAPAWEAVDLEGMSVV